MHSVVSLPDFHIHTHWSGQSEIVLWIIHDVKISIKNRQCSSFLTDIFKCLFHPDSSHFWAPSLVRTWKKGHIVDQLWYRGQQKKVLFFYRLESFRKHRHLLVPFQGFHQKWCYFFFFFKRVLQQRASSDRKSFPQYFSFSTIFLFFRNTSQFIDISSIETFIHTKHS